MNEATIWLDEETREIYQGNKALFPLAPLERTLLTYFMAYPQVYLTKTEIVENVWPDDVLREGVTDDALYQLIRSLRKRLRKYTKQDTEYIVNWRGYPEGGYRFFPKGKRPLPSPPTLYAQIITSTSHKLKTLNQYQTTMQQLVEEIQLTLGQLESYLE